MNKSLFGVILAIALPSVLMQRPAYTADITNSKADVHPAPQGTHGWSWKNPPDLVQPKSGKRNNLFYVDEALTFEVGGAARTWEVRNYYGTLVASGKAAATITIPTQPPGWYKLYLYGSEPTAADPRPLWGDVVGGTTFVVVRRDPHFPDRPAIDEPGGSYPSEDEPTRDILAIGPQRYSANADNPAQSIKDLDMMIAIDQKYYLGRDPVRPRDLMIAFPNGTKNLDGVRQIVEHFKNTVKYWEPRNEPNYGSSAADFVTKEMKPFYDTVKAVDPNLKVMGPGTVSINNSLRTWIDDFFKASGGKYIDVFSFHAYNTVVGDLWLIRQSMDGLNSVLAKYGADKMEKWQTEQGYFAAVYGSYQPRLQGRWTMLQMMAYEQYGIPKEHDHLWYDRSHGFWDVPTWWENDDGSLNPAAPLMRVWSEELFGAGFTQAYDFGTPGNSLYIGSLFTGPEKSVAAFQSAGSTDGQVNLTVTGGGPLRVVSPFGVVSSIPVKNGQATLNVPELPVYVELKAGQTIAVQPTQWGDDLALMPGVSAVCSPGGLDDKGKPTADPNLTISKLYNGKLENWYYDMTPESVPFNIQNPTYPCFVELRFPHPITASRVVVYAGPPWQSMGTLLDYDLQYDDKGQWRTLQHVTEPENTFAVYTPPVHTSVDSFFSDRWIFQHHFKPVTTSKFRLLINNATHGGGANGLINAAGGQCWGPEVVLREIEVYPQ